MSKHTTTAKPRTWVVIGRDQLDRVVQNGPFTSKAAAISQAQTNANRFGTPQRVSTRGSFGSLTVEPSA